MHLFVVVKDSYYCTPALEKKLVNTAVVQNRICFFSVLFNLKDVTEQFHSNEDIDVFVILELQKEYNYVLFSLST